MGPSSHFFFGGGGAQESCPPQFFSGLRTQDRKKWPKKGRFLTFDLKSEPHSNRRSTGGDLAAYGRYLLDGAWSCIPEHAASSADFIADLKSSIEGGQAAA